MKKISRKIFWGLNIISMCLFFREVEVKADINDNYLNFNNITINEGLSQGSVDDIFQDSEGYMWFATNDGLNRYDGYDFKVFKGDSNDVNTIWPGLVSCIVEDKFGALWVGTSGGLAKIDKKTFKVTRFYVDKADMSKISNHNIWDIYTDSNDDIWIGTEDGLNKYDYLTGEFKKYLAKDSEVKDKNQLNIIKIEEDNNGEILIATNQGIREVDEKKGLLVAYNENNENLFLDTKITDIYNSSKGEIWLSTLGKGLYRFNKSTNSFVKDKEISNIYGENNTFIRIINEDANGDMWFGTNDGLFKYSEYDNGLVKYENKAYDIKTLVNNTVLDIFRDKSGLMWIGTINGISKVNPKQEFINYQKRFGEENTLSGKSISGIYEDEFGDLWIGTNTTGLNKIERKDNKYIHYNHSENNLNTIPSNNIWQVTGDGKGTVWVATKEGLCKIDTATNKVKRYTKETGNENSLVNNDVREIFIDDKGFIWIGTRNGLCVLDPKTEKFTSLNNILVNNGIEELFVRRVFQDSKGDYWLAVGWNSGLVKVSVKGNKVERFTHEIGKVSCLSDNVVMSINEGLNGDMWVATTNGLNKIDSETGQIKVYKEKDGLGNGYVYGVLIDEFGAVWVSTNGGISKLDTKTDKFENYTYVDGLQSNEFNVTSDFKSKSGTMFFGGVNGVSSFKPRDINKKQTVIMPVVISDFYVYNNQERKYADNISLDSDENNFTVNFILPDYGDSNSIKYEYMLDGFDDNWVNAGARRDAIYTNISSGKYTFKVRARLKGGELSEETSFVVFIAKPWYFSNVAIGIYLGILVVIVVLSINYVKILDSLVKQKTFELNSEILAKDELHKEKEKLFKELLRYEKFRNTYLVNLSHELRTPLNVILSSQQLISSLNKDDKGVERSKLDKYMNIIKSNSKELLEVINDLIDSSKIKSGAYNMNFDKNDIVYIVEEVALGLKSFVENEGLELIIDPEIEEKIIDCSKKEIERCVTNLISNAVKFTEQGEIYITIRDFESYVEIVVRDSGKGISKEDQSIIFDRFTQIEDGISSKHCSSGIGLNLVKDLVGLHKGTISIVSEIGKGSEFTIKLPVKID
ncbi:two-component regulator propeller domain-containing protein [uncultured Clostridium sp.]|jgi:signal transduction histidine kinase/ligand-binding sensor domain-containing protein|uniref:ligand-binding sensor domain-containing protein n=1 Tax=uncultured Clostridium sp. TaxID=59620 RepID=UPI0026169C8A|nr:sensor histidine kinase [uncultured Clostridium sp.]